MVGRVNNPYTPRSRRPQTESEILVQQRKSLETKKKNKDAQAAAAISKRPSANFFQPRQPAKAIKSGLNPTNSTDDDDYK